MSSLPAVLALCALVPACGYALVATFRLAPVPVTWGRGFRRRK